MKLIADRLLLSRAWFLLGFTSVKLNKNKMKKVLKTVGLQHRRDYMSVEKIDDKDDKIPLGIIGR